MAVTIVELLPLGVRSEPLFENDEEYRRFRDDFTQAVAPAMVEHDLARALSERDSRYHWVD